MSFELELVGVHEEDKEAYEDFDCGIPSINRYLLDDNAYFEHIMKLSNTKLIKVDNKIVGFFTMQFKEIRIENGDRNIYPCIYLKYICVDENYQKMGIGTKVLNFVVRNSRITSDFIGCRCLLIDAITSKIEWYNEKGFDFIEEDDKIDLERSTVEMIIDFRDNGLVEEYIDG